VGLRFLMQSAGEVSASDIDLATASEAIVIAFNVPISQAVQAMADKQGVEVRKYDVIYELLDDMRKAMEGMLDVVEVFQCTFMQSCI
jgi:translation initiation factor IF-2